ncbi:MAG: 4Fe-4S binding protein [Desulfobacterales bacterium]|nr:4Fe-4S binding protein [Desulfobacterales bacterium]
MAEKSPYKKFAEMMMHPDSEWIPKILECMTNESQAALLVSLPGTSDEMAKRLSRTFESVDSDLKDLFKKGLAFKKEKGGITQWRAAAHLVQFHDASILWADAPAEFYNLWRNYMEQEWHKLAENMTKFLPRPFTRVVPVEKSIDAGKVQVLAPENVRKIIESSTRIAVTKCTCRLSMKRCDAPIEVCLQINRGADYTIERGSGREITKEEALEIINQSEQSGLVHVTMNKADVGHFICNCCGCCCQSFSLLISNGLSLCDPSRYRPEIDSESCVGCGVCEDRCWFDAIAVGSDGLSVLTVEKCLGCGQCVIACPNNSITFKEVREAGFIPQ